MSEASAMEEKQKINPLLASQQKQSLADYFRAYVQRLSSGDLGSLPIIIGLIVIAIIFQNQNSNFLTPRNFVNLILQMSGVTMIAYGVVFVLLLGEIDLSIGYVSAVGGVSVAILLQQTDVMALVADGMPETLPMQASIFLFLRQWGLILFPLILAGLRLLWHFVRVTQSSRTQNQTFIQAGSLAIFGLLLAALFQISVGWTWYNTIAVALVVTACIGLLHGFIITFFRVPSFIVTLAGLLAWNGVMLKIIGSGGTVIIQDTTIVGIANSYLPKIWEASENFMLFGFNFGHLVFSWGQIVLLAFVVSFALLQIFQFYSRNSQGLSTVPIVIIVGQVVALFFVALFVAHISDQDRGVPVVGLILLIALVFLSFVTNSTQFGRFVYAVGGNAEAARRAGINVTQIRLIVFMISSFMAGMGGIILASRLRSVDTGAGGGNLLLNAIASAVIGGTSLFGGRGHISSAVLGALVIIGVDNGMGLLNLTSGDKFIITGVVLIVAVVVDALSQRRQQQSGLR
jgi:D-xylose transport system permease protein